MDNLQSWNQSINNALQLFFLAEDFVIVARPNTVHLKHGNCGDNVNFPILLEASNRMSQLGLGLATVGTIRFAAKPNDDHFCCTIPISITGPEWLLNAVHRHCNDGLFEIPNDTFQGTIVVDFQEDDHVYEQVMFGNAKNFTLDPLVASALRKVPIPEANEISDLGQWCALIFDEFKLGKNDIDAYFRSVAAAQLILTNICNLGAPRFKRMLTLCALAESLAPLEKKFPEAFQ